MEPDPTGAFPHVLGVGEFCCAYNDTCVLACNGTTAHDRCIVGPYVTLAR